MTDPSLITTFAGEPRGELFSCPDCNAAFYYKPPARKRMFCICGHVFAEEVNLYEIAEDDAPWARRQARAAIAVPVDSTPKVSPVPRARVVAAGTAVKPRVELSTSEPSPISKPASVEKYKPADPVAAQPPPVPLSTLYGKRPRAAVVSEQPQDSLLRDAILPTALITASLFAWLVRVIVAPGHLSPSRALVMAICEMVLTLILTLIGGFFTAFLFESDLGSLGKAFFKLAALALSAGATAALILSYGGSGLRFDLAVMTVPIIFLIYSFLMRVLFMLDVQECLAAGAIMLALQLVGALALISV